MNNGFNGLLSWLIWAVVSVSGLLLALYVFAFLLPFVLILIGVLFLFNLGRYWYFKYKLMQAADDILGNVRYKRASAHKPQREIIDVDYEVVDNGK